VTNETAKAIESAVVAERRRCEAAVQELIDSYDSATDPEQVWEFLMTALAWIRGGK
jgi:hypothetical protein